MTTAKKHRVHRLPEPYEGVEVSVNPIRNARESEPFGLTVGVMDRDMGQGHRYSIDYAEALAKTILKATRAYRRANPDIVKQIEEADRG